MRFLIRLSSDIYSLFPHGYSLKTTFTFLTSIYGNDRQFHSRLVNLFAMDLETSGVHLVRLWDRRRSMH